ncbi:MAG: DUF2075 domain-containing protein [Ignavibacteria bacterium]|nr:DUF2075 domain-containing protein [Ignavibacteria bacterium]
MRREFYSSTISKFLLEDTDKILGILSGNSDFADLQSQKDSWFREIQILRNSLSEFDGGIFFEYSIPRMGRRIDVVLIIDNVLFVLEFKIGQSQYLQSDIDQVWDYALDLKNFHETSHGVFIAPILIATDAKNSHTKISITSHNDILIVPLRINEFKLGSVIQEVLKFAQGDAIDSMSWSNGRYSPTPTIIEAAISLFRNHTVENISRSDASAKNLLVTSKCISQIIDEARAKSEKAICFVTGVPGAGKTLIGLDIATKHMDKEKKQTSVYLSGNGPLVAILREALTRDKVKRQKELGEPARKGEVFSSVKTFIQNVHHFRDECLVDDKPPFDHVAIFDEAQRAWNQVQTANFMKRKKKRPNFALSEPEFLISCLDRHKDWSVIVCLVGGGQEINVGEAGISEWVNSINRSFPNWHVYVSNKLTDSEYDAGKSLDLLSNRKSVDYLDELHLSVSMRSFRAENVSHLVKSLLDRDVSEARNNLESINDKYPIVVTRDLGKAKNWLKEKARGSERYGVVVSSQAQRLKPYAIDVKSPMNPVHWFLNEKDDVRSSYYLEHVATEFHVQGLELDWACVAWDGDFRYSGDGWKTYEFRGNKWQKIKKEERKMFLKNAYRVLLTRARQGMIIVVPEGDCEDPTRAPDYYDSTYRYLLDIGFNTI